MSGQYVGQVAVCWVVVVVDVAGEADDVEEHVVQVGKPRLGVGGSHAIGDGGAQSVEPLLRFVDVGLWVFVACDGKGRTEQLMPVIIIQRQLIGERVEGRGATICWHDSIVRRWKNLRTGPFDENRRTLP